MIVTGRQSRLQHSQLTSNLEDSRSYRGWLEVFPPEHGPSRASPSAVGDRNKVKDAIKRWIPQYEPRLGQIETLYHLLYGETDVILQAGTGYGKSVIFQLLPVLAKELCGLESSTLMISPLNSLTEQQISSLQKISSSPAINGIAVTGGRNHSDEAYDRIGMGEYTHVCISPELACEQDFRDRVIKRPEFRKDRVFLIIDEAHCIVQWSTFRREYGKFGGLRLSLAGTTRAFGTSATLRPPLRNEVLKKGPFHTSDVKFINTTVDRPEIFIDIRFMEASKKSMEDLHWLIPQATTDSDARKLRKTIVFFDSRKECVRACVYLRAWLRIAGVSQEVVDSVIAPYHAILSQATKDRRLQTFIPRDSPLRILLATDAVGMGVNIEGVELVIQYGGEKILKDLSELTTLMQRMGRGARQEGEFAAFVWIVEGWAKRLDSDLSFLDQFKDTDLSQATGPPHVPKSNHKGKGKAAKSGRKGGGGTQTQLDHSNIPNSLGESGLSAVTTAGTSDKSHSAKRADIHPIYQLMLWDCPRRAMMKAVYAPSSKFWRLPEYNNRKCCSFEYPGLRPYSLSARSPTEQVKLTRRMKKIKSEWVRGATRQQLLGLDPSFELLGDKRYFGVISDRLKVWRVNKLREVLGDQTDLVPEIFLADIDIDRIASLSTWLDGEFALELLHHFVPGFELFDEYGGEIVQIVAEAVQETTNLVPMKEYKANQKAARQKKEREELEAIISWRKERYGDYIPVSEVAGAVAERAILKQQQVEPARLSTIGDVVERVDNQDPRWKETEQMRPDDTDDDGAPSSCTTSIAGDEGRNGDNSSFISESEIIVDNPVDQSFSSTATTVISSDTIEVRYTSQPQATVQDHVGARVQVLRKSKDRRRRSTTPIPPPISPPARTPTRLGRVPKHSRKLLEAMQSEAEESGSLEGSD